MRLAHVSARSRGAQRTKIAPRAISIYMVLRVVCAVKHLQVLYVGGGDALDIISLDRASMEEYSGGKVTGGHVRTAPHACLV